MRKEIIDGEVVRHQTYDPSKEVERNKLLKDFKSEIGSMPADVSDYIGRAARESLVLELSNTGNRWQLFDMSRRHLVWESD